MPETSPENQSWIAKLSKLPVRVARSELYRLLHDELRRVLGIPKSVSLGSRDPFMDLGIQSLQAVEFKTHLETLLHANLPSTLLFDYPTLEQLEAHLAHEVLALDAVEIRTGEKQAPEAYDTSSYTGLSSGELQSLLARAERKLSSYERQTRMPIAVVGMACRYPGHVTHPEQFWEFLLRKGDGIDVVPKERWNAEEFYDPRPSTPGKICTTLGGFLEGVDSFDADLFGISPREVEQVDPQQRLLLEIAREAFEDAGRAPSSFYGTRTGVYVGMRGSEYHAAFLDSDPESIGPHMGTGGAPSAGAGRISYTFGLRGPAVALDTACSSALVAVHEACRSLRQGDCEAALACAVNLLLDPRGSIALSQARMLSPHGRCKTFDAAADGYVRAEGCVALLLKPLDAAQRDGDRIYAVLKGSAVNQDGASGGLTVPSGPAQEAVMRQALEQAAVKPYQVAYVEAHGTGTLLGDPIEVRALNNVFTPNRYHGLPLYIGSVKTNIGHLEMAAGLAGLMKVVLGLHHESMAPQRNFDEPNPHIDWSNGVAQVLTERVDWPRSEIERIALVSSFGFAGTNACVVVAEAPPAPPEHSRAPSDPKHAKATPTLLPISANSPASLAALLEAYALQFERSEVADLHALCAAAALTRDHLPYRHALVIDSAEQAKVELDRLQSANTSRVPADARVAFLFTGQGSQYPGMGRRLYETEPDFRSAFDDCARAMAPHWQADLKQLTFRASQEELNDTRFAQPSIFALEYALLCLWQAWGVQPDVVLGHSVGEFAAACAAGVLTLEGAAELIVKRGELMSAHAAPGAMLTVHASVNEVRAALQGQPVAIAAINASQSVVVSGSEPEISALEQRLRQRSITAKRLSASHAFHSPLMEPTVPRFQRVAETIQFGAPTCTVISTVTGQVVGTEMSNARYFSEQIVRPVRFSEALDALLELDSDCLVEVGPNPTLTALGRARPPSDRKKIWLSSLRPPKDERRQMLQTLAGCYEAGVNIDFERLFCLGGSPAATPLPAYPYDRKRYWFSADIRKSPAASGERHPILGQRLDLAPAPDQRATYETLLDVKSQPWLVDHSFAEQPIYPAMAYVIGAIRAARLELGNTGVAIRRLEIREPLLLGDADHRLQFSLSRLPEGHAEQVSFRYHSTPRAGDDVDWTAHAMGEISLGDPAPSEASDWDTLIGDHDTPVDVDEFYAALAEAGLVYGPSFRRIEKITKSSALPARVLVQVRSSDSERTPGDEVTLLDALLQGVFTILPEPSKDMVHLPFAVESLWLAPEFPQACYALGARTSQESAKVQSADVTLHDAHGRCVGAVRSIQVQPVSASTFVHGRLNPNRVSYHVEWVEQAPARTDEGQPRGTWLIIAEDSFEEEAFHRVGHDLAWELQQAGYRTELISSAALLSGDLHDVSELVQDAPSDSLGVVFLAALDRVDEQELLTHGSGELAQRPRRLLRAALALVQCMRQHPWSAPPALWLVTSGAQEVAGQCARNPSHAVLWGLGVTLSEEWPELRCLLVDLDPTALEHDGRILFREAQQGMVETRVSYRGGKRFVARMQRGFGGGADSAESLDLPEGDDFKLFIDGYGTLSNLKLGAHACPEPGAGQLQIEPRAAGLNFKDVLFTLGVLEDYAKGLGIHQSRDIALGFEASGVVTSVGHGVSDFAVGQEVIAIGEGLLSTRANVPANHVIAKPEGLSLAEAAALPTAYLTALYGLEELARISPDDTVLIHAAAGGVGQAAVQIAMHVGARVLATASEPKRALLRTQGVLNVFDSRSTTFAEQVMEATDGRGVDIVLNSLKGEFAAASLGVLAPGGRMIELGKIDTLPPERVEQERPDVSYHQFDLSDVFRRDPVLAARLLGRLRERISERQLGCLPISEYSITESRAAFRFLAQGKNVGKVVLTLPEVRRRRDLTALLAEPGSYLITGGLGGLGLATAARLAEAGAPRLVLVARGAPGAEQLTQIAELRERGVDVLVEQCDVSDPASVQRVCEIANAAPYRLRGVVHAAGALVDSLIDSIDLDALDQVLGAKTTGILNLHAATRGMPLDFFVCYSSAAAQMPSEGQSVYAAANAYLDAFSSLRRGLGEPGLSINWGLWADVGMGARMGAAILARYKDRGLTPLPPGLALDVLAQCLCQAIGQLAVVQVNWKQYLNRFRGTLPPALERFGRARGRISSERGQLARKLRALPADERAKALSRFVRSELANVAALPGPDAIDPERAFVELGVDSLLAMDLRNGLEMQLDCSLSSSALFDHPNVRALVQHLLLTLFHEGYANAATESAREVA